MSAVSTPAADGSLARHGSTFALAARGLDTETARLVARLYAVCRALDDFADEAEPAPAQARLTRLRHELATGRPRDPLARELVELAGRGGFPITPSIALVDGLLGDLEPVRVRDVAELDAYAYRVAGTVGEMMAPLLGASGAVARRRAVDLGIAMQLTNIARDVLDDARAGRRYLPARWADLAPEEIAAATPAARATVPAAVLRLLDHAEAYYASGRAGLGELPLRSRLTVAVAGEVYRAIGDELRARDGAYWHGRAVVPRRRRWRIAVVAALGAVPLGAPAAALSRPRWMEGA